MSVMTSLIFDFTNAKESKCLANETLIFLKTKMLLQEAVLQS